MKHFFVIQNPCVMALLLLRLLLKMTVYASKASLLSKLSKEEYPPQKETSSLTSVREFSLPLLNIIYKRIYARAYKRNTLHLRVPQSKQHTHNTENPLKRDSFHISSPFINTFSYPINLLLTKT